MGAVRTVITTNILTGMVILVGFVNNVIIASLFGLNKNIDSYFSAVVIPTFIVGILTTYIGKTFLPVYARLRHIDRETASIFASRVVTIVFLISLLAALTIDLFAGNILAFILPGLNNESIQTTITMLWILSPSIVFAAVTSFNSYVWQYEGRYEKVVAVNIFLPVAIFITILLGRNHIHEFSLAVGYTTGRFLVFIVLATGAAYTYRPSVTLDDNIKKLLSNSGLFVITGIIGKSRVILEKTFASMLGAGAISALSFSNKLCQPLQQSATIGLRMMAFTKASKLIGKGRTSDAGNLTSLAVNVVMLALVPLVVWIAFSAYEIVEILFKRGAFTENMHSNVSMALIGMVPMVLFASINPIVSNTLFALDKIKLQVALAPVSTLAYVIFVYAFKDSLAITGLALSMSLSNFFVFMVLSWSLGKHIEGYSHKLIIASLLKYVVSALCAYVPIIIMSNLNNLSSLLMLVLSLIFGTLIYMLILMITGDQMFYFIRSRIFPKKIT